MAPLRLLGGALGLGGGTRYASDDTRLFQQAQRPDEQRRFRQARGRWRSRDPTVVDQRQYHGLWLTFTMMKIHIEKRLARCLWWTNGRRGMPLLMQNTTEFFPRPKRGQPKPVQKPPTPPPLAKKRFDLLAIKRSG